MGCQGFAGTGGSVVTWCHQSQAGCLASLYTDMDGTLLQAVLNILLEGG